MSLTRKEWIEMFADAKLLESLANDMEKLIPSISPFARQQLRRHIRVIRVQSEKLKYTIQEVIGQME